MEFVASIGRHLCGESFRSGSFELEEADAETVAKLWVGGLERRHTADF